MKKYNVAILGATGAVGTEFGYWLRPAVREPSLR